MNRDVKILQFLIDFVKALKAFRPTVQVMMCFGFLIFMGYESHLNHDLLMAIIGIVHDGCRTIEMILLHLFIFVQLWRRLPPRRLA